MSSFFFSNKQWIKLNIIITKKWIQIITYDNCRTGTTQVSATASRSRGCAYEDASFSMEGLILTRELAYNTSILFISTWKQLLWPLFAIFYLHFPPCFWSMSKDILSMRRPGNSRWVLIPNLKGKLFLFPQEFNSMWLKYPESSEMSMIF